MGRARGKDYCGGIDDDAIRTLVTRLARPHASGGEVIERAAILAEGADFGAVMAWLDEHGGRPEAEAPSVADGGLHGSRLTDTAGAVDRPAHRIVLPAGALA
jgi:hypothetical protein